MELFDIVRQAQGGNALANMARTFNLTPAQAEAAVKATLPELARGIERNTLSRGGVADLIAALGDPRKVATLEDPQMFGRSDVATDGNAILGHLLGTKDASRAAAQRASLSSGVGEGLIKMLLPYIAQMLMGALANKTQGGLGDILSKIPGMPGQNTSQPQRGGMSLPGPQQGRPQSNGGGLGDILSKIPGMPGQPANSPSGRDPNFPFPQASSQPRPQSGGGGFGNQQPLPMPTGLPPDGGSETGSNPYGDLSDIIRQGGSTAGAGGGALWSIVRNMLGGALGFSTKGGVMGWIFRAIILRYGWSIVRTIFGGVLGRR